jgi:hypothetical protein
MVWTEVWPNNQYIPTSTWAAIFGGFEGGIYRKFTQEVPLRPTENAVAKGSSRLGGHTGNALRRCGIAFSESGRATTYSTDGAGRCAEFDLVLRTRKKAGPQKYGDSSFEPASSRLGLDELDDQQSEGLL